MQVQSLSGAQKSFSEYRALRSFIYLNIFKLSHFSNIKLRHRYIVYHELAFFIYTTEVKFPDSIFHIHVFTELPSLGVVKQNWSNQQWQSQGNWEVCYSPHFFPNMTSKQLCFRIIVVKFPRETYKMLQFYAKVLQLNFCNSIVTKQYSYEAIKLIEFPINSFCIRVITQISGYYCNCQSRHLMAPHLDGVITVQYDFLKKSCLELSVLWPSYSHGL